MGLNAAGAALSKCVFSDDRGGLAYPPPPLGVQAGTPGRASLSLTAPGPSAVAARALGQIFESTVLSRHAVHPMADARPVRGSAGRSSGPAGSEKSGPNPLWN
jgi:hypothetical protein